MIGIAVGVAVAALYVLCELAYIRRRRRAIEAEMRRRLAGKYE